MESFEQNFENIPVGEEKKPKNKNFLPQKMIVFGGIFFAVLLILVLGAILLPFLSGKSQPASSLPTPTPSLTPTPEIANPSFYATDSAILKIEEDVKKIEEELDSVDIKEKDLIPPALDWEIKF